MLKVVDEAREANDSGSVGSAAEDTARISSPATAMLLSVSTNGHVGQRQARPICPGIDSVGIRQRLGRAHLLNAPVRGVAGVDPRECVSVVARAVSVPSRTLLAICAAVSVMPRSCRFLLAPGQLPAP